MKLIKTAISGYSYTQNKRGVTYFFAYKDKETKNSKRVKLYTANEHSNKNLEYAINIKDDVLKNDISKLILNENNSNIDETLNIEHFTLNEIIDLHHERYYNKKVRELREIYSGVEEVKFNNNAVVKKKLYAIKKRILQYNKNVRNSSLGDMKFKDITKRNINNYLEQELNQNLALKTKYNIMVYVRSAISSMKRNGLIKLDNPFVKLNGITNNKRQRTRVLKVKEIELLLEECKKWNKPLEVDIKRKDSNTTYKRIRKANYNIYTAVYLGLLTAARSSSILTIKKKDIDFEEKTISLINHKAKNSRYKVPLNPSSIEWFKKKLSYYNDNDYLLQANTTYTKKKVGEGNSLTFIPREVFRIMNRLFNEGINRKVNFERDDMVNFHTLRRSVATHLAKNGASIYKVKQLLDHKSVDITEKYLNLSYEDYKESLENFHNELFDGFSNFINEDKDTSRKDIVIETKPVDKDSLIKQKLINEILKVSGYEGNENMELSLDIKTIEELKHKLVSYI